MHGRLKVRTSEEEAARKKKEQDLKVKAYRAAMGRIQQKRISNELDQEMMTLSGQVLARIPDVYTLWNIRKECLLELTSSLEDEEKQAIFDKDLGFAEQCLMVNPKSYGAWHHRCWVLENSPTPNWMKEVQLCTKYLKLDERNFHCWDYRRFVVKKAEITSEKEFEFCTEKIKHNFSNYSSWHYRSKLLPILHPHPTVKSRPISEEILKEELELVLTAAFTDPNDSSAWFYQRWLLGYSQPDLDIAAFRISKDKAVIAFTKAVNLMEAKNCSLSTLDWKSATGEVYDNTWVVNGDSLLQNFNRDSMISLDYNDKTYTLELSQNEDFLFGIKCPRFEYEFGAGVLDTLKTQLDSCNELLEYEPDSKWTLLTASLLMRAVDRKGYHEKSLEFLKKLQNIDSNRKVTIKIWLLNGTLRKSWRNLLRIKKFQ
uniref:Geranylgeranyl transferase type-2 subunit alpha n=1 Tax=Megaselia scalaris TaxID=36166 RepID=T1GSK2_MEGSC